MGSRTACQAPPEQTHAQITLAGPSQDWTLLSIQGSEELLATPCPGEAGPSGCEPGPAPAASAPGASPVPSGAPGSCRLFPEADGQLLPQRGCVALVLRFPWQTQAPYVSNYSWCSFLPAVSRPSWSPTSPPHRVSPCGTPLPLSQAGARDACAAAGGLLFFFSKLCYLNRLIN